MELRCMRGKVVRGKDAIGRQLSSAGRQLAAQHRLWARTMNSRWLAIWPEAPVTATRTVFCQFWVREASSCRWQQGQQAD